MLCKASLADDSGLSEDKFNAAEHRKYKQIGKVISLQPLSIELHPFVGCQGAVVDQQPGEIYARKPVFRKLQGIAMEGVRLKTDDGVGRLSDNLN